MTTTFYSSYGLDQTVRVGADGTIVRGIDVPHEAANIACNAVIPKFIASLGEVMELRCRKRVGHDTPEGEEAHVAVDIRLVAAPPIISRGRRFSPSGIPAGVDQTITVPHDCGNHLIDVEDVARGYR